MATFPTSLDTFTNPTSSDKLHEVSHSGLHVLVNQALSSLENKVGITSSAVTSSLDYLVTQSENPGHTHTSSSITEADPVFLENTSKTHHYTGYPDTGKPTIIWSDSNRTVTLSSQTSTSFDIYIEGLPYTITNGMSAQLADTTALHWFWIELNAGTPTLSTSSSAPGFHKCLTATVYWNSTSQKGLESNEMHWMGRDRWMHEYLHQTVGARWAYGLTGTFTSTSLSITAGEIYDEDIEHEVSTTQASCTTCYKSGSANWLWDSPSTVVHKTTGTNVLCYNNGNTLTAVATNEYVACWVFATNNINYPIVSIIGQRVDTTIANARANNTPDSLSLGSLPSVEMKLLYRVIFRQAVGSVTYVESADYRSVSNIPVTNYVSTDHSSLTKLDFANSGHSGFAAESHTHAGTDVTSIVASATSAVNSSKLAGYSVGSAGDVVPILSASNTYTGTIYVNTSSVSALKVGSTAALTVDTSNRVAAVGCNIEAYSTLAVSPIKYDHSQSEWYGISAYPYWYPTTNTSKSFMGVNCIVNVSDYYVSANLTGSYYGGTFRTYLRNSKYTISNAIGGWFYIWLLGLSSSGGIVTTAKAGSFGGQVSYGTITNFYGNHIENVTGAGAVTNAYGLYIAAITKGGTLNRAIYSAGGDSVHMGSIKFGNVTAPTATVDVSGNILASTTIEAASGFKCGGTAAVADGTYDIINDGVSIGQVTSITVKGGIITGIAVIEP